MNSETSVSSAHKLIALVVKKERGASPTKANQTAFKVNEKNRKQKIRTLASHQYFLRVSARSDKFATYFSISFNITPSKPPYMYKLPSYLTALWPNLATSERKSLGTPRI